MNVKIPRLGALFCAFAMVLLILDSACAAQSVQDAIDLCLKTIIPSLFPLFVLSGIVVSMLGDVSIPFFSDFCNLPRGSESIFLLGLVGGFPMGAQCIVQSIEQGNLSRRDAERMLGVCNNCGPAFIFGILGGVFSDAKIPLALLLIQAEAAILTASLWPGKPGSCIATSKNQISVPKAVSRAVRSMVSICSWVIVAKVILGFLERWLFPFLPEISQVIFTGILELTSGCLSLAAVDSQTQRLLLCCAFVCFGGISVLLQIQGLTAAQGLSMKICVAQKLTQMLIGVILGCLYLGGGFVPLILIVPAVFLAKKAVEKSQILMYNNPSKGGI